MQSEPWWVSARLPGIAFAVPEGIIQISILFNQSYGVVANLSIVAMSIFNGLAQGAQPLISDNYGKGHNKQVKDLLLYSLLLCLGIEV